LTVRVVTFAPAKAVGVVAALGGFGAPELAARFGALGVGGAATTEPSGWR
jgi:hypothetical protein